MPNIALYAIIGLLSGVISGMGIGGGSVLIPSLVIFTGISQLEAQNINLIYFIPTAIIALIVHFKKKTITKKLLPILIISGLLSACAGSFIAAVINAELLRKLYGGFLFLIGLYEVFKKHDSTKGQEG